MRNPLRGWPILAVYPELQAKGARVGPLVFSYAEGIEAFLWPRASAFPDVQLLSAAALHRASGVFFVYFTSLTSLTTFVL